MQALHRKLDVVLVQILFYNCSETDYSFCEDSSPQQDSASTQMRVSPSDPFSLPHMDAGWLFNFSDVTLQVTGSRYVPLARTVTGRAEYISFNAVECAVPVIRSYLISISNNGVNRSRPLLFIPFDSACSTCNIFNTSCTKIVRSLASLTTKYCDEYVRSSVCLSVHSDISITTRPNFNKYFVRVAMWPWFGLPLTSRRCDIA